MERSYQKDFFGGKCEGIWISAPVKGAPPLGLVRSLGWVTCLQRVGHRVAWTELVPTRKI